MKKFLSLLILTTCFLSAGCQSKSYKIEGTCDGIADGDTLFLTNDAITGKPIDTLIVKDGKFEVSGNTDSTSFCMVYSAKNNELNIPFFIEPGTIKINLSMNPYKQKVSGTEINERWQTMNDTIASVAMEIDRLSNTMFHAKYAESEQKELNAKYKSLNNKFKDVIKSYAKKNIDNELGYFIITYYPEEFISPKTQLELINKMPQKMRNRAKIRNIEKNLKLSLKYDIDGKLDDFKMKNIKGQEESILNLVKQHKVTVIDFWASWCGPCRAEMPSMVDMYKKLNAKGLGIVGISLDQKQEAWEQAVKQLNITWAQLSDLKGWQNSAARMFNVNSIPYTIVVDKDGKILNKNLRGSELYDFVESQLK